MRLTGKWILRAQILALVLVFLMPGADLARAQAVHCGPPYDWQNLANLTRRSARRLYRLDPEAPRRMAEALRELNWPRLRAWQTRIERPDIDRLIFLTVEELRNYASTGRMTMPLQLLEKLSEIDSLSATVCIEVTGDGSGLDGGFAETEQRSPAGFGMSPNGETFADYARLSLLPVMVAAFAVILKTGHILLKWYHTLRYGRRSCRVFAELHIGPYVIPGEVTVLGLQGCRFVSVDDDARALLSVVAGSSEMRLQIGSIRLVSEMVALHDGWAALRFKAALTEQLHITILERSKVRPRYVALPGLDRNVEPAPSASPTDRA